MEDRCRHSPSKELHHPRVEETFIQNMRSGNVNRARKKGAQNWENETRKWRKGNLGNEKHRCLRKKNSELVGAENDGVSYLSRSISETHRQENEDEVK
jgi:hypothetical protein